jgi:hypothetical protein
MDLMRDGVRGDMELSLRRLSRENRIRENLKIALGVVGDLAADKSEMVQASLVEMIFSGLMAEEDRDGETKEVQKYLDEMGDRLDRIERIAAVAAALGGE